MAITEESRHRPYQRLEQVLGADEASILMSHLPPVGWADVATKRDLDALVSSFRAEIGSEITSVRIEIAQLRTELHASSEKLTDRLRTQLLATFAGNLTLAGFVYAAATFA